MCSSDLTLGPAIVDGVGRATLQKIDALWAAIISQVPRTQFVEDAGHQLDLMRAAVERKRPADADKAALHIEALVNAELNKLTSK